jgi:hypothetical protein
VLEPLDFIARLAALVPPPRVHLTRFHGVFAAHAALRAAITPGGRGAGAAKRAAPEHPAPKANRMSWARRLKRVFGIEIERCVRCGGRLKVIASIEEPELIERILAHRRERGEEEAPTASLGARAPPQGVVVLIPLADRHALSGAGEGRYCAPWGCWPSPAGGGGENPLRRGCRRRLSVAIRRRL